MAGHIDAGEFGLIVLDTPISSGGIDFFTSPARIRSLVGGRILRFLTWSQLPEHRTL